VFPNLYARVTPLEASDAMLTNFQPSSYFHVFSFPLPASCRQKSGGLKINANFTINVDTFLDLGFILLIYALSNIYSE
jgi:hypothetical protein